MSQRDRIRDQVRRGEEAYKATLSLPAPALKVNRTRLASTIYTNLVNKFAARGMSANEAKNMAREAYSYADAFDAVTDEGEKSEG